MSKSNKRPHIEVKEGRAFTNEAPSWWWFRIVSAGNHKVVMTSEVYNSRRALKRGIEIVNPDNRMRVVWP